MNEDKLFSKEWYLENDFSLLNKNTIPELKPLYDNDDGYLNRKWIVKISVSLKYLAKIMNNKKFIRLSIETLDVSNDIDVIDILMRAKELILELEN